MEATFQTHLDSFATPNQSAGDVRPLFADDSNLDPLFLVESWTLGVAAATESLQRRRQVDTDRENRNRAFRELDTLGTLHFVEDRQHTAESALADRAATIVDRYDAASSQSWTPQDWVPEDRITQSWIPQGWTPSLMPHYEPLQQAAPSTEFGDSTMTTERACLLLEVSSASTREQVRSAYRRMVGQWHPDRLQFTTEAIRNHATQHMAALNEAYRLLCATLLEDAA
jgi:DnaJ-domain-containing protein 1